MKKKFLNSTQNWLPFLKILDNGVILLKDFSYVKILKITPINYNLKSNLEKEAILNSYKLFLKTCDFDIQIFSIPWCILKTRSGYLEIFGYFQSERLNKYKTGLKVKMPGFQFFLWTSVFPILMESLITFLYKL